MASTYTLSAGSPFLGTQNVGPSSWPSAFFTLIGSNFDIYRYNRVKITWIPYFNVNATNGVGADDNLPQIAWVSNYDDTSTPASYDAVLAQSGSRFRRFDRPVSLTLVPRALTSVAAAGGNTNAALTMPGAWYNCGGPAVLFLGAKFAITASSGTPGGGRFDVNYEIDISCLQNIT